MGIRAWISRWPVYRQLTGEDRTGREPPRSRPAPRGLLSEPYRTGRAGRLLRVGRALTVLGTLGAQLGQRSRVLSALPGRRCWQPRRSPGSASTRAASRPRETPCTRYVHDRAAAGAAAGQELAWGAAGGRGDRAA